MSCPAADADLNLLGTPRQTDYSFPLMPSSILNMTSTYMNATLSPKVSSPSRYVPAPFHVTADPVASFKFFFNTLRK